MDAATARTAAGALLEVDGVARDHDTFRLHLRIFGQTIAATVPETETWAVLGTFDPTTDDPNLTADGPPELFVVEGAKLWRVYGSTGPHRPTVSVLMTRMDGYGVSALDTEEYDTSGAYHHRRAWMFFPNEGARGGDDRFGFWTEAIRGQTPEASREERVGRALAAACGWEVTDFPEEFNPW